MQQRRVPAAAPAIPIDATATRFDMELTDTMNPMGRKPAPGKASARKEGATRKPLGDLQLLAIVGLLCLLPVVVLGVFAAMAQGTALGNARAEAREQGYAASVGRFLNAVMAHQRHTAQWLSGDLSSRGALERSSDEANAALGALDAANPSVGETLAVAAEWRQLRAEWIRLTSLQGVDALRAPDLHRALVEGLGDFSGLVDARRSDRQAERIAAVQGQSMQAMVVGGASVAVALVGVLLLGARLLGSIRVRQSEASRAAEENRRNQIAILRLMDELSVIAGGDLTDQAAVTEEITGAIADSVNVTVGQLQTVVRDINQSTGRVAIATEQAQKTARALIADTARQAEDIEAADVSVEMMTQSMAEVSGSANESAAVARRSLATTERGARAVQDSIGGMNEIRQQIQETAKRIKRLGESSQEIGEIVDVITEIAEQTNVLALNAAIQAAAAGEAGRAFAVVAEEVQLLAERSADATTQIAGLVRAIQTDTQEAATAMESSIQGVVEGARLSDTAGRSLNEIEAVTRDLAEMIQRIAVNTETQVVVAEEVRKIMRDVLQVTATTTEGTQRAATAVTEITEQAQSLKGSVSKFKVA
jgi:methyl-accepting chemotaxis protein